MPPQSREALASKRGGSGRNCTLRRKQTNRLCFHCVWLIHKYLTAKGKKSATKKSGRDGCAGGRSVLTKAQSAGPLDFCSGGRVGSQRGFVLAGPVVLAKPHPKHSLPPLPSVERFAKTEYSRCYADPVYGYCAMPKKPLVPYDPTATRSRTAHLDAQFSMPPRNASQIRFDSGAMLGGGLTKRTPSSSYRSCFPGLPVDRRENAGSRANALKILKKQMGVPE